jgi:hypothetical protein
MTSVETLMDEYIAEHRRGGDADPIAFLNRAEPPDRRELAALIDAYLARAPRTPLAQHLAANPRAEATVEALSRSISGSAGLWPALLPSLRDRAGLKRRELVERLAAALGVSDRTEKVGLYYHEMEQGLLPARGVSDRVLDALAKLVGSTAAELRDAGAALGSGLGDGATQSHAFARTAFLEDEAAVSAIAAEPAARDERDEVDELFRSEG